MIRLLFLQRNHLAMRTRKENAEIFIISSLVFALQFAWYLHKDAKLKDPPLYLMYPYSNQEISMPAWIDYACRDISYLLLVYLMTKFIPGISQRLSIFFWLWLGYFFDYLLCYNEPFIHIPIQIGSILLFTLPVSYSLFAGLTMIYITLYDIRKK